ncbi:Heat shock protein [Aspergillus sp. HF37]|nr:Heat shock protein [Aspergillus sp. HF37]
MSDPGRKNISTKAEDELTPESTKPTQERFKESVTDTVDRVFRGGQPDENKSATQGAWDKGQRVDDDNARGGGTTSISDEVKTVLGVGGNE